MMQQSGIASSCSRPNERENVLRYFRREARTQRTRRLVNDVDSLRDARPEPAESRAVRETPADPARVRPPRIHKPRARHYRAVRASAYEGHCIGDRQRPAVHYVRTSRMDQRHHQRLPRPVRPSVGLGGPHFCFRCFFFTFFLLKRKRIESRSYRPQRALRV